MIGPGANGYHHTMTDREVRRVRERLGLTQREFARRLGVHKVPVAKWEASMRAPRGTAESVIRLLAKTAPRRGPTSPTPGRPRGRRRT